MAEFKRLGVAHWKLSIPAIDGSGFFRKVSGLSVRAEHTKHHFESEQGSPVAEYQPSGTIEVGHLTLERGVDTDKKLWDWHMKAIQGEPEPAEGTLELMDHANKPVAKFKFNGAWPAAYKGPAMRASGRGEVATETIEIAIDTLERIQ